MNKILAAKNVVVNRVRSSSALTREANIAPQQAPLSAPAVALPSPPPPPSATARRWRLTDIIGKEHGLVLAFVVRVVTRQFYYLF